MILKLWYVLLGLSLDGICLLHGRSVNFVLVWLISMLIWPFVACFIFVFVHCSYSCPICNHFYAVVFVNCHSQCLKKIMRFILQVLWHCNVVVTKHWLTGFQLLLSYMCVCVCVCVCVEFSSIVVYRPTYFCIHQHTLMSSTSMLMKAILSECQTNCLNA